MEYELFCVNCEERMQQKEDVTVRVHGKDVGEHTPHVIWICPKCEAEIIVFFDGVMEKKKRRVGRPLKANKLDTDIRVRISKAQKARLEKTAEVEGKTMSGVMRERIHTLTNKRSK